MVGEVLEGLEGIPLHIDTELFLGYIADVIPMSGNQPTEVGMQEPFFPAQLVVFEEGFGKLVEDDVFEVDPGEGRGEEKRGNEIYLPLLMDR